jgi:predicted nucleic acid-binding protein
LTLVVDASVALWASGAGGKFDVLGDTELVAPPLLWSECLSSLHAALWRRAIPRSRADAVRAELARAPIAARKPRNANDVAWRIADELGWAKTYDAEYLALGQLLGCRVVTLDARLRRGADRLDLVVTPGELA